MTIKAIIETGNAAFDDGYKELEAARIVADAADKVERGDFDFKLRDINGNTVGRLAKDEDVEMDEDGNYIVIEFSTDNAAFEDSGMEYECARILREAASRMRDGDLDFKLRDFNGNTVGAVSEEIGTATAESDLGDAGKKMALMVGSLQEGFSVEAILPEDQAEDAARRLAETWHSRLAEAIEIEDPASANVGDYEAVPDGNLVVVFGTLSTGIEAYGPFDDHGTAVEFADSYREENDVPYEIFEPTGGPESIVDRDGPDLD